MRIVLSGIFYPMAILRYFEKALRKLERESDGLIEVKTAGPYTGRWIPWNHGMILSQKYARPPDIHLPKSAINRPIPFGAVERRLPWVPDLWIEIDAGFHFAGRPKTKIHVIVGTDPHVLNYEHQRRQADKFFCMQKVYMKPGDIYLPYARDVDWHRPLKGLPALSDAALLGLHYENRNRWVQALREAGLNVEYDLGPVFDEAQEIYSTTRIGLNWSSLQDLNARAFELMGFGLPVVMNRVPDASEFFEEGVHYLGFEGLDEAIQQVLLIEEDADLAERLGRAAAEQVETETWEERVMQILEEVGSA